jgi:pimeloyl-ACP methyl ester carboxylesterase
VSAGRAARRDLVVGQHHIASWREGTGPPVILIHGWLCDHQDMGPLSALIRADHDVVSLDLRGHGVSGTPASGFGLTDFAADVLAVIDQLQLGPALLVGHSLGAAISLDVAVMSPESVRGILIVDSQWTMTRPPADLVASAWNVHGEDFEQRRQRSLGFRRVLQPGLEFPTPPAPVAAEALNSMLSWDGPTALRTRSCPVHSIVADANWPTVKPILPMLADLDAFSVSRVTGTGHWVQLERADAVADALRALESRCRPIS